MTATIDRPSAVPRARIVMVVASLEPGGTQRQLCLLAGSLRNMGYSIKVLVFHPNPHFGDALQKLHIPVVYLKFHNRLHLAFLMRRTIRMGAPNVVIGFNHWANLLVELSGLPIRPFSVIVSERSLDVPNRLMGRGISYRIKRRISYYLHRFADVVVSNSHSQGEIVDRVMRRSRTRRVVIVNGVDTQHFQPSSEIVNGYVGRLKLLVVARISPEKNVLRFIDAVKVVRASRPDIGLEVNWYGDRPTFSAQDKQRKSAQVLLAYYRRVTSTVDRYRLGDSFHIRPAQKNVRELYLQADAMCLPSLVEGCSNVIAEAMACGKPVLASRVGDNTRLVKENCNGYLFDPLSVEGIAQTIIRFSELPVSRRTALGKEGRRLAKSLLSAETLAGRYGALVSKLIGQKPVGRPA